MRNYITLAIICLMLTTELNAQTGIKVPKISTAVNELISLLKLDIIQTGKLKDIFTSAYSDAGKLKTKLVTASNEQKKKAYRDLIQKTDEKVKAILKSNQIKDYTNWRNSWTNKFKQNNPSASEIKQLENDLFL